MDPARPIDPERFKELAKRVFGALGGATTSAMIWLGDRLGLYHALHEHGAATSADDGPSPSRTRTRCSAASTLRSCRRRAAGRGLAAAAGGQQGEPEQHEDVGAGLGCLGQGEVGEADPLEERGILDAPVFARVVRSEVLALRSPVFVESAVAVGNPTWRIMFIHLLPNAIQGAMAQTAVRAAWAVRISATLAFLGVGIQAPTPEWGAMIRQGAEFMITGQWWVALFPGIALIFLVFGLNMFGDGLQELLNPRRKAVK